ncbi:MAG TPA: amino acid permease [Terriglobales bacterium]|jgi:L-asparagine transporter-like permease|nr:amino acid permease [Terriglobales bacterium]
MPEPRNPNEEQGLRHELSAGQIAMVAVGGSIGTGLLLGSASAIGLAGPAVILSYLLAAFINFTVACALGELACAHPAAGSFGVYGDLYLNDWAGFLSRGGYWAAIAVSIGTELVASGIYMGLWFPSVPRIVWVSGFSLALLLINLIDVGEYGRFEFWFAMVKVVTIATFIALGTLLLVNGHTPPQYVSQGGFFPQGFLAPLLAMTFAIYAFGGIEFVAVSSGEARSPNEIAKAMRITFAMLTFLYLGSMAVLVGVMPWNQAGGSESPFVTVFRSVNIPGAAHLMNFVVLTAALSGANAALYVSSRMLFSMARSGWAPARLGLLNKQGSPKLAVLISSYGIVVALVMEKYAPRDAFEFILRAAFFGMMLSWIVSLAAHVSFRHRATPEQIQTLPLRSPLGGWGSILGFTVVCAVILKGWWDSRVNLVSGVLYLLLLTAAWWVIKRTRKE